MIEGQQSHGQGDEWRGRVGDAWSREWLRTDRSFAGLSRRLHAAILDHAPDRGVAIDLGCGAGETSIALAKARPALDVAGVDLSDELIAVARHRGAGIANLSFSVGDGAALDPATAADLLVSRHGVMFFDDPLTAFLAIRRAARPGATLVFSCFADRARNPWANILEDDTEQAYSTATGYMPGPFAFADRDFVARLLADAGWIDARAIPVDYAYIAGAGDNPVDDARSFFSHIGPVARTLAEAPLDRRADLFARLDAELAAHRDGNQVAFPAAAWIWTARAGEST